MGKKRKSQQAALDEVDEAAIAAQEAEEAELRAEIAALGGNMDDLDGIDNESESSTSSSSSTSTTTTTTTTTSKGSSTAGPTSGTYDKAALASSLEDIRLDLPFRQKLNVVSATQVSDVLGKHDVHDDLKRELAFYEQAQASVAIARQTLDRQKVPYLRPDDYYAEKVKSDGHMQRIRDSLLFEEKKMAAFEQRKKNQEQRKFGKQLQHEKQVAKAAEKRATLEAISQIRKKRGQNNESGPMDSSNVGEFDVRLEREVDAATKKQKDGGWVHDRKHSDGKGTWGSAQGRKGTKGAADGGFQKSFANQRKDAKYGNGDGGRKGGRSKRNNETMDDAGSYGKRSVKRGGYGDGGGSGGGSGGGGRGGGRGGGGGGRGGKSGGQRPGKKARMSRRN